MASSRIKRIWEDYFSTSLEGCVVSFLKFFLKKKKQNCVTIRERFFAVLNHYPAAFMHEENTFIAS